VSERHALPAAPAIRAAGEATLRYTGRAVDEIAHVDLYSCFPAAVEVAAAELGLDCEDRERALTVTGGLTFAGGPGNNYASHAVARLVELLRGDADSYGLASAVGWYLTKHALSVFSARPPARPFASFALDPRPARARRALGDYAGPATLEAYTVTYRRDGTPEAALISALTPRGERAIVRSGRGEVIDALLATDPLGWSVALAAGGRLALEGAAPGLPVAVRG
jgi:acetyl-CoA C-acetyltransferase